MAILAATAWLATLAVILIRGWLLARLPLNTLSTAYLLPTVAGPFIVAIGLRASGDTPGATAAFGVGVFFWATVGGLVMARLIVGTPLAPPAIPSLAILMSAPAAGGLAWYFITDGRGGTVMSALLGILGFMGALQLALLPTYLRVPFGFTHWLLLFPLGATANLILRLLADARWSGWILLSGAVLAAVSGVFCMIALASIVAILRRPCRAARHPRGDRRPGQTDQAPLPSGTSRRDAVAKDSR